MPNDAPAAKVAATEGYGGQVIRYDRHTENRLDIGNRLSAERGLTIIPPYDHPHVIAGQGTATKELIEDLGDSWQLTSLGHRYLNVLLELFMDE